MTHLVLIGNPNCGKTTLFNALTGDTQKVGNWPGVTVEKKTGHCVIGQQQYMVTDLPGIYSLGGLTQSSSHDEYIAAQAIVSLDIDCIVNVVDACHLERHLYLSSQLLELGKPLIVVLNMMDIAHQQGIDIDLAALTTRLGCPVIPLQAHKEIGLADLFLALSTIPDAPKPWVLPLSQAIQHQLHQIEQHLIAQGMCSEKAYYQARRLAEGDVTDIVTMPLQEQELDVFLADARYQLIHELVAQCQKKSSDASEHFTAKLDRIMLHRVFALPIFFGMMYLMFLFAINVGGAFQDFFDIGSDTLFVQGSAWLLTELHAPHWLIALIAHGVGKGINTTLTFIPVIAAMFFFLSLLETSGYMARAAFVVDKLMRFMGLPGKSFVPMIVGFGCNVPAIMAARTLDSERDRLLTVMMSPFMSCSARLAIYAVFVSAFFPSGGQNVVFSLYLIGILMAVLTGFLLRKTHLKGTASTLILELPTYHKPALKRLYRETLIRLRFFVIRAGSLIIPICVLLGGLNALSIDGGVSAGDANTHSVLSMIGQWMTPLFAPMGITQDNWPATVGLLTGMLAKEVVVGTLNTLYAQTEQMNVLMNTPFDLWAGLSAAVWSIPHNLMQLGTALWNPIAASAADNEVSGSVYGIMAERFDGQVGAYAYLLFVLLYIPCVSTMAVIRQEANRQFMWFSIIWSLIIAYSCAVVFYQSARFLEHPEYSISWICCMLLILMISVSVLRSLRLQGGAHVVANT